MKISNKRELQQIALNYLSDMGFKTFMQIYKVNDKTLPSDNPLRSRKNLLK